MLPEASVNPFFISNVLAPTDLSETSLPALRYARMIADRFLANITVLYTEPIVYPLEFAGLPSGAYFDASPEQQNRIRLEVQRHADPEMGGRPYNIEVVFGQPVSSILVAAKRCNADLVIMGTHLRHGWRRALLGSVSAGVMHGSDCPVLTVAAGDAYVQAPPVAITNLLCPVNFTDVARESLRVAARLAEAFGAHLNIVHVIENDVVAHPKEDEQRVRMWVSPELQDVLSYRELVVRGDPAERVLDCVDDVGADLLVVGAQHRLFRNETVVGTTTERLTRYASCPVLVVPRQTVASHSRKEAPVETAVSVNL
jgi:nucleotide-binding universal stress UspA family protein